MLASARKAEPLLSCFRFRARGLFAEKYRPFFSLTFDQRRLLVEVDKDRKLRPENLGHHRGEDVINRA